MRAVIGISLPLEARRDSARERYSIPAAYADCVIRAGGVPVHLTPVEGRESLAQLLEHIDALIIPGGGDFVPEQPYPEHVSFAPIPARQLAFDRALLHDMLERDLPVLGVCYGMQLLALELGGRLHYDIGTDLASADSHQLQDAAERHTIEVASDSHLGEIVRTEKCEVNSRHHQAVAEAGPRLYVTARAPDGVIEAIESKHHQFALGVQWHPETLGDAVSQRLFEALVQEGRDRR